MHLRRDTLAAAATAALEIREVGIRHGGVTTVGSMRSEPGVITAVAGVTEMMLDLRHLDAGTLATMLAECLDACEQAAAQFDCTVQPVRIFGATPTPFHPQLVQAAIDAVARRLGAVSGPPIPSGPLHDATEVGRLVPTVMLFAQSDPPLSHTKIEDSPDRGAAGGDRGLRAHGGQDAGPRRRRRIAQGGVMDFGVVLQNDPPAARVIDLCKRAETYGFSHAWTFDSHLLWQEPYVVYSRILDETHKLIVGPMVTNPATRDWTVTGSLFATLNEMYGNRTICGIGRGDSAVRVINGKPVTLREMRESIAVIRGLANGEAVDYKGTTLQLPWNPHSRLPIWVAAYGPKMLALTGEIGDGFILQLADPAITQWSIGAVRAAAQAAGRDPTR